MTTRANPEHNGESINTLPRLNLTYTPPTQKLYDIHAREKGERALILDPSVAIEQGGLRVDKNKSLKVSTSNDNGPWGGNDDGRSFAFGLDYRSSDWKLGAKLDGYTRITVFDNSKRVYLGARTDHLQISAEKKIFDIQGQVAGKVGNILGWLGGGVQGIGDFGGSRIQNTWHKEGPLSLVADKNNMRYGHGQTYESYGKGESGKKYTPDIRVGIEGSIPIIGDRDRGVSAYANADAKIALSQKYGESSLSTSIGLKGDLDRVHGYVGITGGVKDLPGASAVMKSAQNNPYNSLDIGGSVDVYKSSGTTTSIFMDVKKGLNKGIPGKDQTQGTIGIKTTF